MHLRGRGRLCGTPAWPGSLTLAFLPYDASSAWTRSGARWCACWSRASGSWNGKRRARPNATARSGSRRLLMPRMWIAPVVAVAARSVLGLTAARRNLPLAAAVPGSLARRAVDRLVDQPADRTAGAGVDGGATGLPAPASRARPGIFLKPSSPPRKTGCRRTIFRRIPSPTVASRTSPTNMGLALLANLAARDFGYLSRRPADRAHRSDLRHDAATRTASRAFLQLVRHAHAQAAPAALYFQRGQRQPRRTSADARLRAEGIGGCRKSSPRRSSPACATQSASCGAGRRTTLLVTARSRAGDSPSTLRASACMRWQRTADRAASDRRCRCQRRQRRTERAGRQS